MPDMTTAEAQAKLDQVLAALGPELPPQKRLRLAMEQMDEVCYRDPKTDDYERARDFMHIVVRSGETRTAEEAIEVWRRGFIAAVAMNPGDVLWWRIVPEIDRSNLFDDGRAVWMIYSRFSMERL